MITRFTMYFSFQRTELCCERLKRRFFWVIRSGETLKDIGGNQHP